MSDIGDGVVTPRLHHGVMVSSIYRDRLELPRC
jgi:hypothetical protein